MKKFALFFLMLLSANAFSQKDIFNVARTGTVDEAKALMKAAPNCINETSPQGYTPLILACYRGNNEVAKLLAKNVKDINAGSGMGTALMAATVKGNVEMAKFLLENKADPDRTDANGTTALIYAVQFSSPEIIKLLLAHKADKAKTDNSGKTAFEYAAFTGNETIINLLK
ncbi:MAG TPA: ankyrin repeat domain-containing protein [Flavobacterium sp.]|nr:ankyrin repeat domain-containing protein [Flavobacterium sp.]